MASGFVNGGPLGDEMVPREVGGAMAGQGTQSGPISGQQIAHSGGGKRGLGEIDKAPGGGIFQQIAEGGDVVKDQWATRGESFDGGNTKAFVARSGDENVSLKEFLSENFVGDVWGKCHGIADAQNLRKLLQFGGELVAIGADDSQGGGGPGLSQFGQRADQKIDLFAGGNSADEDEPGGLARHGGLG